MNCAQPRKKGKKRKAESGEHPADAEDAPKQSAGITNILKRFRSVHTEPNEAQIQQGDLEQDAAAGPSGLVLGDAKLLEPESAAEGAAEAVAARTISEGAHETAGQPQGDSAQLPASLRKPGRPEADGAGEEADEGGKHRAKRKQPQQASDAVLPWMRLPVSITAGQGVQLGAVGGLDPRLRDKMHAGQLTVITLVIPSSALAEGICQPPSPHCSPSSALHVTMLRN